MNNLVTSNTNTPTPTMAKHALKLVADIGLFKGLANQNMLFHECIGELVDNSIAAKRDDHPFRVDIIFTKKENSTNYYLWIVDNSKGMSYELLRAAMQPGQSASEENRLNEPGFRIVLITMFLL